jgi:predicted nucleic acid-binding Zn ribbon protein
VPLYTRRCKQCGEIYDDLLEGAIDWGDLDCECGGMASRIPTAPHIDSRSLGITQNWIERENERSVASGGRTHEPRVLSRKNQQVFDRKVA